MSAEPAAEKCPNCQGRGTIRIGRGLLRTTEGCEDCRGTGRVIPREQLIRELNAEIAFLKEETYGPEGQI